MADPGIDGGGWIAVLVFGPMLAATAAALMPAAARLSGLAGTALTAVAAAGLVLAVANGPVELVLGGWAPPLGLALRADGLSALMIAMTAGVGLVVGLYADAIFGEGGPRALAARHYWPLWLTLLTGMNALFLSQDVFNLYVAIEIVSLAAVALAALGGGAKALRAAFGYLIAGLAGSALVLLGVDMLYAAHGRVDLAAIAAAEPGMAGLSALLLIVAGLSVKAALFPLHFWMPAAHSGALPPASALLSALVVKAGLYVAIRLWWAAGPELDAAGTLLGATGAAAILWGSVQALRARRLKLLVAYSTVAQVGLIALAFALAGTAGAALAWQGAILLILAHAVAKAAMFLAVGRMADVMGHDRIAGLRRAGPAASPALVAFALAAISLIGLPPSAGFAGKWMLLKGTLAAEAWVWLGVLVGSTALSAAYLWRVISRGLQAGPVTEERPRGWHRGDLAALGLAGCAIALGLAASAPLGLLEAAPFHAAAHAAPPRIAAEAAPLVTAAEAAPASEPAS